MSLLAIAPVRLCSTQLRPGACSALASLAGCLRNVSLQRLYDSRLYSKQLRPGACSALALLAHV